MPEFRTIRGQLSWVLRSSSVELAVTHLGAHMAPVIFEADSAGGIEPYAISPWQGETEGLPAGGSELPLRGDFFCLPFGGGPAQDGELHPPHGATSSAMWTLVEECTIGDRHTLTVSMDTPVRSGRVTRTYELQDGHNAIYGTTSIQGFVGPATLGHHAVLDLPSTEGGLLLSSSPMRAGFTYPKPFGRPEEGSYQSLAVNRSFRDLHRVPSILRGVGPVDCSVYPARRGYTDLLQIAQKPQRNQPCWIAAVNTEANYLWFALKDPSILPSTIVWIENRGRHRPPWSGRNCSLGLEDVCSYFDLGIKAAMNPNPFQQRGVPTFHRLTADNPFMVRYIQGAVRTPMGFGRVKEVEFLEDEIAFLDEMGKRLNTPVRHCFVMHKPDG
jgi:hypothetical protein